MAARRPAIPAPITRKSVAEEVAGMDEMVSLQNRNMPATKTRRSAVDCQCKLLGPEGGKMTGGMRLSTGLL